MQIVIMIAQLILGLSILVVLHEFGHFWAARAFGIRVEKFFLFFDAWGFKFFSFKYKGTEYGLGWLPLGGYVKIAGMVDESLDINQLAVPAKSDEFRTKPAWQRLIVMVGGVVVNAVLAVIIFTFLLLFYGEKYIPNNALKDGIYASELANEIGLKTGDKIVAINGERVERFDEIVGTKVLLVPSAIITVLRDGQNVDVVVPKNFTARLLETDKSIFVMPRIRFSVDHVLKGSPAYDAGLHEGDSITDINGKKLEFFDEVQAALKSNSGKVITMIVVRDGKNQTLNVEVSKDGTIGFYPKLNQLPTETKKFGIQEALPGGFNLASKTITDNLKGFGRVFSGDIPASRSFGGPIAIAKKMYGGVWDWYRFWMTTGLLSVVLAFMNILPIPALDGGHVMFLLYEMFTGKPVSEKVLMVAQYIGMAILLGLMVFIFGNDIWQHLLK
jgi:regulator of sigma E protease